MKAAFHLALPCDNIDRIRAFYVDTLGAKEGRSTNQWIDIDLYGNQLTFTNAGTFKFNFKSYKLGNQRLPSFHFGVVVDIDTWGMIYSKLSQKDFDITTEVTFLQDKIGEHVSFFIKDPCDYMIEFKSFKNGKEIFRND